LPREKKKEGFPLAAEGRTTMERGGKISEKHPFWQRERPIHVNTAEKRRSAALPQKGEKRGTLTSRKNGFYKEGAPCSRWKERGTALIKKGFA